MGLPLQIKEQQRYSLSSSNTRRLGHGFNAVTGVTTRQVIKLDVEHTNEFTHSIMGTMQIPGNVDCTDLSYTRREKASTLFFESSEEYRHHIAVRKGLFGTIKGIYLSGSVEFQNAYTQSFLQQLALSESIFDQPLYRCWFLSNEFPLTSSAESLISRNQVKVLMW